MRNLLNNTLINISIGAAWGLALSGAFFCFYYFLPHGIFISIFLGFVGLIPGVFLIMIFEYFLSFIEYKKNSEKQTQLLEEILKRLPKE